MPFTRKKNEKKLKKNNKRAAADAATIGTALADLGHVAGDQAKLAAERAQILASEGIDWASPRVQQAWEELDVPQCGYCQAGQMMAAAALAGALHQREVAPHARQGGGQDFQRLRLQL